MNTRALIDIAAQTLSSQEVVPLSWVGMRGISLPLIIAQQATISTVDIGVDLIAPKARGIHMSRLYLALPTLSHQELTIENLNLFLQKILKSHHDLSSSASITIKSQLSLARQSLMSNLTGHKSYPIEIKATLSNKNLLIELGLDVYYSSTCPCSAALSRQLIQEQFLKDFANQSLDKAKIFEWLGSTQGILATPHSQRSIAQLNCQLNLTQGILPIVDLINAVEKSLGTAVQTAVKRIDEQAFALANGQNLMFCEDAARRIHRILVKQDYINQFKATVIHQESLHAHDAVAVTHWQRSIP
jgi:GTP cyclohydrolase I